MSQGRVGQLYRLFLKPIFWLVLAAVLLAVSSLLDVPMFNDEGVWAYIGRIWADHGLLPYTGAIENKATGIYMLYALSHKLFGANIWFPRLVAIVSILLTGEIIRRLAKKLSGAARAGIIAMSIFLFTMPLGVVDGASAETETFMNLWRVLTFLLILSAFERPSKEHQWRVLLAGVFFSWAIAFKQLAITDGLPLLVFIYFLHEKKVRVTVSSLLIFVIGAVAGTIISLIPFLISGGTIPDYLDGAWIILTQSGSSPHGLVARVSGFFRHFFLEPLFFFSVGLLGYLALWKRMKVYLPLAVPLLVWALTDFIAYNADGWYLGHHFKVFIPSWAVIFGIVAHYVLENLHIRSENTEQKIAPQSLFVVLMSILIIFFIPFNREYYQNVRKYIKGNVHDHRLRDLGLYAKQLTAPGDYIYVWGFHIGPTYYYSARLPPSRYFSEPFLGRPGALAEVQSDLGRNVPKLIIVLEEKFPLPEWLRSYIDERYELLEERSGHSIFVKSKI